MQNKSDGFKKQIRRFEKSKSVVSFINESTDLFLERTDLSFETIRFVLLKTNLLCFENKFVFKFNKLAAFKNKLIKNKSKQ